MPKITESAIEKFAIELLEKQGYQYIYAPSIAPDSDTPERQSFEDVWLFERLQTAVGRISQRDGCGSLSSKETIIISVAFRSTYTMG